MFTSSAYTFLATLAAEARKKIHKVNVNMAFSRKPKVLVLSYPFGVLAEDTQMYVLPNGGFALSDALARIGVGV